MSGLRGWPTIWAACFLMSCLPLSSLAQTNSTDSGNSTRIIQVCTLDRPPMSFCNSSVAATQYTGLSLETYRQAALTLGLTEGTNYEFKCLTNTTGAVINDLASGTGQCDIAIASITITSEREALVEFAYPYYKGAVGIMVKSEMSSGSGWAWVQPFSTDLWIAIAVTLVGWPAAVYFVEVLSLKARVKKKEVYYGIEEATWRSLWALQHGNIFDVTSLGARIAVVCFSFVALIIGSSYTANLAAFLTVRRASSIRSVYDLSGLAVASVPVYIPRLRSQYGIIASDANITDVASVDDTAELVAKGSLAAFLYDDVVGGYVAATFPGCAVRILKDKIQPFDYGVGFRKGTDQSLVAGFSNAILKLHEGGYISQFEDRFLLKNSPCLSGSASTVDSEIDRISFKSVYGLWVILGVGLVVGTIVMFLVRFRRKKNWAKFAEEMEGLPKLTGTGKNAARKLTHTKSNLEDSKSAFVTSDSDA